MQATSNPDQSCFQMRFNLSAGKVFRRKDLTDKHPRVDRELGRYVRSGVVRKAAQGFLHDHPNFLDLIRQIDCRTGRHC